MARRVRASNPKKTAPKPEPVVTTTPHPVAWAVALSLAGGDPKRLRVVSTSEVVVENTPLDRRRRVS